MTDPSETVVEFLLARLDEADAGIRQALRTEDYGTTERDLHDIAVKQRIVADLVVAERALTTEAWTDNRIARERMTTCRDVLLAVCRLFASVYADHPDYRDEWAVEPPVHPLARPTDGNSF